MAFSTKIKGHHHLQGNVQVYNVRSLMNRREPGENRSGVPGWGGIVVSLKAWGTGLLFAEEGMSWRGFCVVLFGVGD